MLTNYGGNIEDTEPVDNEPVQGLDSCITVVCWSQTNMK